jgi:hypothetical protein
MMAMETVTKVGSAVATTRLRHNQLRSRRMVHHPPTTARTQSAGAPTGSELVCWMLS